MHTEMGLQDMNQGKENEAQGLATCTARTNALCVRVWARDVGRRSKADNS